MILFEKRSPKPPALFFNLYFPPDMETKCGLHGLLALGDILTKVVISPLSAETRLQACTLRAEVSRPALKVCFLRSLPSGQQSEDQTQQIYISRSCYLIQIQVSRSESVLFFSLSLLFLTAHLSNIWQEITSRADSSGVVAGQTLQPSPRRLHGSHLKTQNSA